MTIHLPICLIEFPFLGNNMRYNCPIIYEKTPLKRFQIIKVILIA